MRIAVACAARRGLLCLERIAELAPGADLDVFTFREEAHEPPFLESIRQAAEARGAAFREARALGRESLAAYWETTPPDLLLVVGWRYLVPARVYERPRLGAFVFHDSLLPAYRGFAPTVWAIVNGEDHTGATLFRIAEAVDSGAIVGQERVPIGPDDVIATVMDRVTGAYLKLLDRHLPELLAGTAREYAQDASLATFTCRRLSEDARIDWRAPARAVHDLVRASSTPYPGAFTYLDGRRLTVWSARRLDRRYVGSIPGRVAEIRAGEGVVVLASDGPMLLERVQLEGDEPRNAAEVIRSLSTTLA